MFLINAIRSMTRGSGKATAAPPLYRLIALDIDGTLLDSAGRIRPASIAAINAARARGIGIILASARPPRGMRDLYHVLGLDTPMICYNGAVIHQPLTGRWITHHALAPGLTRQIIETAQAHTQRLAVAAEIFDRFCIPWRQREGDDDAPAAPGSDVEAATLVSEHRFYQRPVTRLLLGVASRHRTAVAQALARRFAGRVAVGITDRDAIHLTHPLADKSYAVAAMAADMGIDAPRVMAIGDAPNDLGMLRWAGLGVAVGDAYPQVAAAADVVAPGSDDDGLAWAIETHGLRDAA